jgi:exodeoxyribonuclease VII large subunit
MPRYIGVVTSPEGAVWHDIQIVLHRRYPLAHLLLSPSPVQGDAAPEGIVRALQRLQRDGRAEVIIVARGGGSAEDLSCFDDERVVRAVFACPIPVISAVGHETDRTLIDEVADLRAPTPSAAAELCSPSLIDLAERVIALEHEARRLVLASIASYRGRLDDVRTTLALRHPAHKINGARMKLALLTQRLDQQKTQSLSSGRAVSQALDARMRQAMHAYIRQQRHRIVRDLAVLEAIEPRRVLRRGYAILSSTDGRPVARATAVTTGQAVTARLADGIVAARVERIALEPLPTMEPGNG